MIGLLNPTLWLVGLAMLAGAYGTGRWQLQCVPAMKLALCRYIRCVRLFWRIKSTKVLSSALGDYLCLESPAVSGVLNPEKSKLIEAPSSALILDVHLSGHISQIRPAVVGSNAIDVVRYANRPCSGHVQEREPVRSAACLIDSDVDVPEVLSLAPSNATFPGARLVVAPGEDACQRVVVKNFAQARGGKIGSSHDALQKLIGQRPATISRRVRASLFSSRITSRST